ncbi:Uncharacterised protein [Legionella pneumophila]|uniref:hypothetical protein n=1 Tax=Legionella pneumophila TaxID=446 RepID=UPI000770B77D|nr:hypothetical protein [Legionella pneumophila]CZI17610.1 Uncharacterised protein [Legionella pneumophila]
MFKELINKMTNGMLWAVTVPIALFILMLAALTGAYTYVVWKSDQVSYEGALGKFSAKANNLQTQLDDALESNKKLSITIELLKKSLEELGKICEPSKQMLSNDKENIISNKFMDINNSLKYQLDLLNQQKSKLEAVSKDVIEFKNAIQKKSDKQIYLENK